MHIVYSIPAVHVLIPNVDKMTLFVFLSEIENIL